MTAAVLAGCVAGLLGVLWGLVERARRLAEVGDLAGKILAAENEAIAWKGKAAAIGDELRRVADVSVQQGRRIVEVEQALRNEVDALQRDLETCRDPKVVGERLRERLARGGLL